MNIKAEQFRIDYNEVTNEYEAVLIQSKMKFHRTSRIHYSIEIFETASDADSLIANVYTTLDELGLKIDWGERVKFIKMVTEEERLWNLNNN